MKAVMKAAAVKTVKSAGNVAIGGSGIARIATDVPMASHYLVNTVVRRGVMPDFEFTHIVVRYHLPTCFPTERREVSHRLMILSGIDTCIQNLWNMRQLFLKYRGDENVHSG